MQLDAIAQILIISIIALAAFVQSLSGFGFGLVAMSLLPSVISLKLAVPLATLISLPFNCSLCFVYRHYFNFKAFWRLSLAAIVAIPLGIALLDLLPEALVLRGLGALIICYALYDFFSLNVPLLKSPRWAYLFGALSGMLTGAYNTGGPPVVIYGNCSRWQPEAFKSNLAAFFLISSIFAVIGHASQGNLTITVWVLAVYAIPAFAIGLGMGVACARRLDPLSFERIVLVLLILAGLRLAT